MSFPRNLSLALLAIYSCVLIGVELTTSQDYVRNYFSDVEGPVPFYAINTTLSVCLLWGTALLFAVCVTCTECRHGTGWLRYFFASQALVFGYLALDDRFKVHERVAFRLGIGDHFILLAVAVFQVLCLLSAWPTLSARAKRYLLGGASLFVLMLFFDACVPHDMVLRLSIEDLAKTWATVCFFLFGWESVQNCIVRLRSESEATPLGRAFSSQPAREG